MSLIILQEVGASRHRPPPKRLPRRRAKDEDDAKQNDAADTDNVRPLRPDQEPPPPTLKRISLTVRPGQLIGVWGARRSGKTTMLRLMAGLERPTRGSILFRGQALWQMSTARRSALLREEGLVYVSADWRLPVPRSVHDNIALAALSRRYQGTMQEGRHLASEVLDLLRIAELAQTPANELTARERVLVSLACALVRRPSLIALDVPELLADPVLRDELLSVLESLRRERSISFVVASEEVQALLKCDIVGSLVAGLFHPIDGASALVVPFTRRKLA